MLLFQSKLLTLALWLCAAAAAADSNCERLKATLTYTQEKAPRDLSSVLPVVVEKVNRVLDGVVDVEVEWSGAELHGRVGEHFVKSTVTRLASAVASDDLQMILDDDGREVTRQCFHVPFTILDTNECSLPAGHPMKHRCQAPSMCVNTIGSYECICPPLGENGINIGMTVDDAFWKELESSQRSPWEVSFASNSRFTCQGLPSTHGCCPEMGHSTEGQKCRSHFQCPTDPCHGSECAENAVCVRADSPVDTPNYSCQCPEGLMGNGRACKAGDAKPQPKVMFDGKTPTELTVKNNFYCGCHKPVVDACSGFPPCKGKHEICTVGAGNKPYCACKPGFVKHEKFGCVDENPPTLKLRNDPNGDKILRLKQGDEYREYMVDIMDDNAEDYLRSLKVSYSRPLPPGCLTQVGEFHVNYTIAMPWSKSPMVRETRRVIIEDIDECSLDASTYRNTCPQLVPQCDIDAGAKCINTYGSYQCKCPSQSSGDGFKTDAQFDGFDAPESYKGGTSCVDTSKPVITLKGPNPKVFKICECGGLSGVMSPPRVGQDDNALLAGQRRMYEDEIKTMIRRTAGAELCATSGNSSPKPSDCVKAIDRTYKGDVDLSDRVAVGEPVQKGPLLWSVPYNVKDDAGNEAVTVWRDIVVQEVDLASVENLIRDEVRREQEAAQQQAIEKAVRMEKAKWEREANNKRRTNTPQTCPACPPCECPDTPLTTKDSCMEFCENVTQSCRFSDNSSVYYFFLWLESYMNPNVLPPILLVVGLIITWTIIRFIFGTVYNPRSYQGRSYYGYIQANDEAILRSPQPSTTTSGPAPPPRQTLSTSNNGNSSSNASFFSPPGRSDFAPPSFSTNGNGTPRNRPADPVYDDSIYRSPPGVITPRKTGDDLRRRNL